MTPLRRLGGPLGIAVALVLAEAACSSAELATGGGANDTCYYGCGSGGGAGMGAGGEGTGGGLLDAGADAPTISPLCGKVACDPDFEQACAPVTPSDAGGADAAMDVAPQDAASDSTTDAGSEAAADAGSESTTDDGGEATTDAADEPGDDASDDATDASIGDDAAPGDDASLANDAADEKDASASTDGGNVPFPDADAGTGPSSPEPAMACHVKATTNGPVSMCEQAGTGQAGAACASSMDCAPGLGCVGPANAGECQPYCCGDPENCPKQTYCAPRPSRDDGASPISVPVCVPVTPCTLLEQKPCSDEGLICGIVRVDGTTSCVPAGAGQIDDVCPCAFGFVCAKSTNKCLKLCHTGQGSTECPGGTCQGGTGGLPAGFGVCVGAVADGG